MYNAFGIVEQSEVRVSGVNVGEVTDLDVNEDKRAVVAVEVSGDLAGSATTRSCSSEPQSLIAEYFIDCEPAGTPLEDGGTIPASQVSQTVQPDLVQNTMREPFKQRFRLLINEFGTGLAGNSEALNEAIRLGAPALTDLKEVTEILRQSARPDPRAERRLEPDRSASSPTQRDEIADFVDEAEDTAAISAERRDDCLEQLQPARRLPGRVPADPGRARPPRPSPDAAPRQPPRGGAWPRPALGQPARLQPRLRGRAAHARQGRRRRASARSTAARTRSSCSPRPAARRRLTLEPLGDFVTDLDDPRRAVEIDERAGADTGRSGLEPEQRDTMGYTGLEGLLNYVRNQTLAINQFDGVQPPLPLRHLRGEHRPLRLVLQRAATPTRVSRASRRRPAALTTDSRERRRLRRLAGREPARHLAGHRRDLGMATTRRSARTGRTPVDAREELLRPRRAHGASKATTAAHRASASGRGSARPSLVPDDATPRPGR